VLREGGSVQFVQMTGGDAFPKGVTAMSPRTHPTAVSYRSYGSLREREVIRAMRPLGVYRPQIRLLGFPDEGLCVLASAARAGRAFESPYTKRESPPESEQIVPGTTYRGDDLIRELTRLVEEFRPTLVVMPHPGDEHPDHCATHLLAHQAIATAVEAGLPHPRVLHYLVHYRQWPTEESVGAPPSGASLVPPSSVPDDWNWKTLALTRAERSAKTLSLQAYRSQMLVMADFLRAFDRPNELFTEGEPSERTACWCAGVNIAAPARTPRSRESSGMK
jgi:LmbE family N-acetylglucosaminyl deacetylase